MLGSGFEYYLILLLFAVPGIALGFTVHELCHAAVATSYGDPTPRLQGRLSLNPADQIDPLGLVLLVLIGFGFARPVQFNPAYVRSGRQRAWVSFAGPLSNLVLAALLGVLIRLLIAADPSVQLCLLPSFALPLDGYLYWFLVEAFFVNVILFAFNLIPLPPLDGYGVAEGLLGARFPAFFHWIDANRTPIYVVAILLFFVLPNLRATGGFSLGAPLTATADWLWTRVVNGLPPPLPFPNLAYLLMPSSSGLASALAQPCLP